jgi:hypothetical protein
VSTDGFLSPSVPQTQIFPTHWTYVFDSAAGIYRLVSTKAQASPLQTFIDLDADNSAKDPDSVE